MDYAVLVLLVLFTITFAWSAQEKLFDWKGNIKWLQSFFVNTWVPAYVPLLMGFLLLIETLASFIGLLAIINMVLAKDYRELALYACLLYCFAFLFMLLGQRIAKDYDGARNIVIYLIPAVFLLYLLQ